MVIDLELGDRLALLAQGLDQLDIGFTVFDHDLVMVASNRRFQQLLNFPDALCKAGTRLQDALRYNAALGEYGPGDVDAQVHERLTLAQKFLPHRFERSRPDGTIIEVCGTPLNGGGMVTTYTDVTVPRERENALRELSAELETRVQQRTAELEHREAELAQKAALLELVVRNVNQGISFVSSDLIIDLCNDKFGELLELPPSLCQPGTPLIEVFRYNARRGEYGPGNPEALAQERIAIARQRLPHQFERTRPSDGKTLEIMGKPTPDGGMVSTYSDISERKDAENRILKLNETLEERVAERSTQLQEAMQTLHASQEALARSAAKATLGTLVASVSHELSTPLGNSLITASTCEELTKRFSVQIQSGKITRTDLNSFVAQMQDGAALIERNLHRAVDLLKNFKQVAADQASEQRRRFDLASVAHEVLDTLSPSLKRYTHTVQLDIAQGLVLDSYPGALGQVMINLVNNAYLHGFEGRSNGLVRIHAVGHENGVKIELLDNGIGMPREHLAQMFQPFFSTKIGKGGTGLGTTIVENLVTRVLGGTLSVESVIGQGTTFCILLPLQAPEHVSQTLD
jgi:signal transduction histidine kinase/PAS domain-containing protein